MGALVTPKKSELIAYSIREALKSLLDTQAPTVRRNQGETTGWAARSRAVVTAHEAWIGVRGGSDEDQQAALKNLSVSIGEMAEVHQQDGLNRRRLVAVLVDRTGSFPSGDGSRLVEEYSELVEGTNASLHTEITLDEAARYWDKSVALLGTLFMPPSRRNERLEELARLQSPTGDDLLQLRRLVVVPGNLEKFLGSLTHAGWLDLLESSGLIDPQNTQNWWVGHSLVRVLKDAYPSETLGVLEKLFFKSTKGIHSVYAIAWAAHDLGVSGRALLLECLRRFPANVSHLAVDEIKNGEASDDFVNAVADAVLNPNVLAEEPYNDPLLEALAAGVNQDNYRQRVTLLVQKVRKFDKDVRSWPMLTFERGISVADKRRFRANQDALELLYSLTEVITAALPFTNPAEILELVAGLSDIPKGRVGPWALAQFPTATIAELMNEVTVGLGSRQATIDDISLVDRLVSVAGAQVSDSEVLASYGAPPDADELEAAIASNDIPKGWLYRYSWSPLFSDEATRPWKATIARMSSRYGRPSKEKILSKMFGEFTTAESPVAVEDLAKLSKEQLLQTASTWRPGPNDWLNSASDLAQEVVQVMRGNLPEWSADPVATATALVHPTYISRYIRMLKDELKNYDHDVAVLVQLTELVFEEPWPVEPLGDDRFDYDETWQAAQTEAIELLADLAENDAAFGSSFDGVVARLISLAIAPDPDYEPGDIEPYERALNHQQSIAFQALLGMAGWDYRVNGSVRSSLTDVFTSVLEMRGPTAEEIRALLAIRLGFLNVVAPRWVEGAFPAIFADDDGGSLGQTTVDVALKWAGLGRRLFEDFKPQVWDAVKRDVPNALTKLLTAMLWEVSGYSVQEIVTRLKTLDMLSSAGESLGHLLSNSSGLEDNVIQIAIRFWEQSLASHTNESLTGFGAFAAVQQIDDERLAGLLKTTLESMDDPLDVSYQVGKRLADATPSEAVLTVLDLMVRRQSHSFDQRMINGVAVKMLEASAQLSETAAYQRLRNALQERGIF